ncbi:hypothetical protein [Sphingobacterium griseoflavum]|uniref:FAS1 domain-containing protein n=1 Tax=Sphingobacterium griseoflavum TaxID=1474952 RepID=A0ABQ3I131_9SPHI|nr:hypothetical protein [Sphingobacterium griseoflavum]GHE39415.1 hypothetical protein GCM10017764_23310 [Sphingobacterium griseoflavum]
MKRTKQLFALMLAVFSFFGCEKGNNHYEDYILGEVQYPGTTLAFLEAQVGLYDSLLLVLDRVPALRVELMQTETPVTLFAITNNSFSNALEGLNSVRRVNGRPPLYIEDLPQALLDSTVHHYAFKRAIATDDLKPYVEGIEMRSANNYRMHLQYQVTSSSGYVGGGQQQIKLSDMNNSIFYRYWQESFTSVVNVKTTNGYVHQLTPSHNFGFSKLTAQLATYQ